MKYKFILLSLLLILFSYGCTPVRHIGLEDVIISQRHSLLRATEMAIFEEFVKYKELHSTFDLSLINGVNFHYQTNTGISTANAFLSNKFISGSGVTHLQTEDIMFTTTQLSSNPDIYKKIKKIFDDTPGRGSMYDLISYDKNGEPALPSDSILRSIFTSSAAPAKSKEDAQKDCASAVYCISIGGFKDTNNNQVVAYIKSYEEFRKLQNLIKEFPEKNEINVQVK